MKGIDKVNSQNQPRGIFHILVEVTPTGKLRRSVVAKKFAKEIQMCYNGETEYVKDDGAPPIPAVVMGGGIGGLFYVYRKMQKHPNMKPIHIYEAAGCLGGKFQTSYAYGINAEYGPLRYEWGIQPLLENLIKELKVPLIEFPSFCGGSEDPNLLVIRNICNILWQLRQDFYKRIDPSIRNEKYKDVESITAKELDEVNDKAWLPFKNSFVYPHEVYINEWIDDFNSELAEQYSIICKRLQALNVHDDSTLLLWIVRWTKVLVANDTIRTCQRGNHQSLIDALSKQYSEGYHPFEP